MRQRVGYPLCLLVVCRRGRPPARAAAACRAAAQTPALNFLGLTAYNAGATSEAIAYWGRSDNHGDTVAPLLLHLTAAGPDSSSLTEAARHRRNPIGTAPTSSTR